MDSAREDPRFPPVTRAELPDLDVEVSVLGPLEESIPASPDAFTIGRTASSSSRARAAGCCCRRSRSNGAGLPSSSSRQTCIKAGLPPDAWQHGATLYRFAAEVFGD